VSVRALVLGPRALGFALGTVVLAIAWTAPAVAAGWLEKNFYLNGPRYEADLPPCNAPAALATIKSRFATKEGRFWVSDLQIVNFDRIHETAFRPWAEQTIPRRFCSGMALISDGRWRPVHYSIIEDAGLIGATWGVQWCVVGIDRNWAYNPACKMAQP
jgi:hypothetical protein